MRVTATAEAVDVVEEVARSRPGTLVFTLGNGCCDSTAAFLFEDHGVRADSVVVGAVGGVPVHAPQWLADQYRDDELVLDVTEDDLSDALSIETDLGYRFVLLHPGQDRPVCAAGRVTTTGAEAPHPPRTPELPTIEVPAAFKGLRLR